MRRRRCTDVFPQVSNGCVHTHSPFSTHMEPMEMPEIALQHDAEPLEADSTNEDSGAV